jgi:anti-anti-sigma factor
MNGADSKNTPLPFAVHVRETAPLLVMALQGELDIATLALCREQMTDALSTFTPNAPIRLILDLSECDYLDSTGIAFFAGLTQAAKQSGGKAVFACPTPRLQRLFEMLDLRKALAIADTLDAAKALLTVCKEEKG